MKPLYIECQDCDATYQIKHDMGERYEVSYCSFCGGELEDFYDPNQRDMFDEDDEDDIEW